MRTTREKLQELLDEARIMRRLLEQTPETGYTLLAFSSQINRWLRLTPAICDALIDVWDYQDKDKPK